MRPNVSSSLARPAILIALSLLPCLATAQDSTRSTLPAVRVTATREGPRPPLELPYAVTLTRPDSLAALKRLGVDELLFAVPGVALANRQNPAQDPRVSIRGFGARSAFGVRGVRVLQDGVPVTLPDGQTPVDVIDIQGADRVEVVRGSASSLYGNAAGGVIDVRSAAPALVPIAPFARVIGGGETPTIGVAGASGTVGDVGYTSTFSRVSGQGYRDYADQRATHGALRLVFAPPRSANSFTLAARLLDVPLAENPGALTRAQFDSAPRMADPFSVRKQAGKTVRQGDLALTYGRTLGERGTLDAVVFGSTRTFANPLTFATIDVDRRSGGASLRASDLAFAGAHALRLSAGADAQWQHDDRQEHSNCVDASSVSANCPTGASLRGALTKQQLELVSSVGPFVRGELALAPSVLLSAGVRADAVRFEVQDRFVNTNNPDDSGDRTLHAVSPSAGLVWRASPLASVYTSVSSSFETPTTTELGNKPDGSAGINPDLQPQRTLTLEVGSKGLVPALGVQWDMALFEARAHDELVPFDIPGGAGRRYYRNAGRTVRRGGELGVLASAGPLSLQAAYSYSHFRYVDYVVGNASYAGNRIPGIPEHALTSVASLRHGDLTFSATADVASAMQVNDANSAEVAGRAIFGLASASRLRVGSAELAPLVALQNLGDVHTVGSVNVNATGGKFYEPAPGRALVVRLSLARSRGDMP
jgi:iron complex outermembrane recepter protein